MYEEYAGHDVAVYGGYVTEESKLLKSASGGIAAALAEHMIKNGGYVAGVVYSSDFYKAEYLLTNRLDDVERFRGSKYIDAKKGSVINDIKKCIREGKKVLLIGLPCFVAAVLKSCDRDMDPALLRNLFTCELVCHGPTDEKVHREYLQYLEKKYKSKLTGFSVRYKKGKWEPSYLRADFLNGRVFEKPFCETEYGIAFQILGRKSCYQCRFKGNDRRADLMIGDFWGAKKGDVYWNEKGVSVIFAETEKGRRLLEEVPEIRLFETDFETAVTGNPMVVCSRTEHAKRERFLEDFENYGLIAAARKSITWKYRIKRLALKIIPDFLKPVVSKIYHKL